MPSCIVTKCGMSTSKKSKLKNSNLRFFSFPRDEKMQNNWLIAINRNNINIKNARVCSRHFDEKCYRKDWRTEMYNYRPATARILLPDAVPTLNLTKTTSKEEHTETNKITEDSNLKRLVTELNEYTESDQVELRRQNLDSTMKNLQEEVKRLTEENKKLVDELKDSKSREQYEILEDEYFKLSERLKSCVPKIGVVKLLGRIFTPGQIRAIFLPQRRKIQWSAEDISAAVALRSISCRAYEFLKFKRNVPLPGQSTLRKWLANMKLEKGILTSVLELMAHKANTLEDHERLVVLSYGEAELLNKTDGRRRDSPRRVCQCVMIRGLFGKWKQPVYYTEDATLSKDHLLEVIDHLHKIGFTVVSIVSGMELKNLQRDLGIGIGETEKCWFAHPQRPNAKIFGIIDAPGVLKSIRNSFLNGGFKVNGKMIRKECVEQVLTLGTNNLSLKITENHLKAQSGDREALRLAAELLSGEVAKAIEGLGAMHHLRDYNWRETADFIDTVNNWFNIFDSIVVGGDFEDQAARLEKMTLLMTELEGSEDYNDIQSSVILNNRALSELFSYLRTNFSSAAFTIDNLFMRRFNMDILNELFTYLNSRTGRADKYSPLDFKYRLRWYIFGEHSHSGSTNNAEFDSNVGTNEDRADILIKDLLKLIGNKTLLKKNR